MALPPWSLYSGTLDPLPGIVRRGLLAIAFFGTLSLVATFSLFSFLTYRLCSWYFRGQLRQGANQFLVLIYNLLLADIQQAVAFALSARFLATNKIEDGTTTCWVNGWFISTGDLASGVFILAIAIHTFFSVVRGRRVPNRVFISAIAGAWTFVYAMAIIGVAIDPNLYVRAGAWCWINHKHENLRLWLHYFWIFVCMFGTIVVYGLIYLAITSHARRHPHEIAGVENGSNPAVLRRATRYMILYPVVYVICTLPLAGGRMASMTGIPVPYWWYCVAGAAISCCGWLDVLMYACTRHALIFSPDPPAADALGLDTYGWRHSGEGFWGTTTTITGPEDEVGQAPKHDKRDLFSRSRPQSFRGRDSEEQQLASQPQHEGVITARTDFEVRSGSIPQYVKDVARISRDTRSEMSGYDSDGRGRNDLVLLNEGGLEL
ncbi:hypothetical protein A1O1_06469 [Capronia coronata CBS 617.96]|uniref:G-protein coupled receptors family 1 profile domain-containing protein n=1 Tax=Capronia coronata CBS 617.96 TaxID=1182541 RepID=W9Y8Y1_9EURO|nr:uncharacterized protein A1O1_06469 [Capronia coronata CBS 617.96]EXJ86100.1 hypothetical protein A1O1_06469 [Capronia coronata CBS 617.96]